MTTNFFSTIDNLRVQGGWKINITRDKEGRLIVSVLYYDDTVGDDASTKLPPMLLKGTATELDEGFFTAIQQPVKETAQLFTNMEQYLKEREQAKLQSQMEKDKVAKAEKQLSEKDKKYKEAIRQVDDLEAKGKYRDAWMKLPDANQYPEHADTIRERKTSLAKKFAPDMFDMADSKETTIEEPQNEEPC